MRQAQGIGINIVIIAAIALLVLVIIAIIVTQSGGEIRGGLDSCPVQGGTCERPGDQPTGYVEIEGGCDEGYICYAPR